MWRDVLVGGVSMAGNANPTKLAEKVRFHSLHAALRRVEGLLGAARLRLFKGKWSGLISLPALAW
jgi:hypothetical protein